jgi:sensor domain CHASE-containing protein
MWITFAIVAGFFAATVAMAYFAVQDREESMEREERHGREDGAVAAWLEGAHRREP